MRRMHLSMAACLIACTGSYAAEQVIRLPPGLSEQERASIARMSTDELAELVRTGDHLHVSAAVGQLTVAGDAGENFDLLLSIAKGGQERWRGDIIVEHMAPWAPVTADAKSKERVDAYVDFLEQQLSDGDSKAVTPRQAVRSLARTVYLGLGRRSDIVPGGKMPEAPHGHQRIVGDLVGLLKDKRADVAAVSAHWLGAIGGYTPEQAEVANAALQAYREVVAAQPAANEKEQRNRAMRVRSIDGAMRNIKVEQDRRAEGAATQPVRRAALR